MIRHVVEDLSFIYMTRGGFLVVVVVNKHVILSLNIALNDKSDRIFGIL